MRVSTNLLTCVPPAWDTTLPWANFSTVALDLTILEQAGGEGAWGAVFAVNGNRAIPGQEPFYYGHVNKRPAFKALRHLTVPGDSPPVSMAWATDIYKGVLLDGTPEPLEAAQAVSFVVSDVAPATLFKTAPTVDEAGAIHFQPAYRKYGRAKITVRLFDAGGLAYGGDDGTLSRLGYEFEVLIKPQLEIPTYQFGGVIDAREDEGAAAFVRFKP